MRATPDWNDRAGAFFDFDKFLIMVQPPLLVLDHVMVTFGGKPLFSDLDAVVRRRDRICLVGRNGSGKSTLIGLMAGQVEVDAGERYQASGTRIGVLQQIPDLSRFHTLQDFVTSGIPETERFRARAAMDGLKVAPHRCINGASGGELRRAGIARLVALQPDLMLLDEPTNHLDIDGILWLENYLSTTEKAFVVVSHDRTFLRSVTHTTLWLHDGRLDRLNKGFDRFEDWRDEIHDKEIRERRERRRLLKQEERWLAVGVSARRRRNLRRLRELKEIRSEEKASSSSRPGPKKEWAPSPRSGQLVVEANGISKAFGDTTIVERLSLRIKRSDRVAVLGINGIGKTTLLGLLSGRLPPDSGTIRIGTRLSVAWFGQGDSEVNPGLTVRDVLSGDQEVPGKKRTDHVFVRGKLRHIAGYLKEFLFDERQTMAPVESLSGGERARLQLACVMARPSNLLILDEPTNDLDVETLDLLQELIATYSGTVLFASHDRDFVDRVATTSLFLEGRGKVQIHAGGWPGTFKTSCTQPEKSKLRQTRSSGRSRSHQALPKNEKGGLSFTERHRFARLLPAIEAMTGQAMDLESTLSDPDLFLKDPPAFQRASDELSVCRRKLEAAEAEWLELAEKMESTYDT